MPAAIGLATRPSVPTYAVPAWNASRMLLDLTSRKYPQQAMRVASHLLKPSTYSSRVRQGSDADRNDTVQYRDDGHDPQGTHDHCVTSRETAHPHQHESDPSQPP